MSARPRRAAAVAAPPAAPPTPSRSTRGTRIKLHVEPEHAASPSPFPAVKAEVDDVDMSDADADADAEGEDEEDPALAGAGEEEGDVSLSDLTPEPGPSSSRGSRRGGARARGRGGARGRKGAGVTSRGRGGEGSASVGVGAGTDEEGGRGTRLRKSVSYREVPVEDVEEDEDEEEEGDDEGVAEDDDEGEDPNDGEVVIATPRRRKKDGIVDDRERVGSGRGGFSVKGAAAAAARARWAKHRAEKAERGDVSDDGERRPRRTGGGGGGGRRDPKQAAGEQYVPGAKIEIRGVEYTVGDDELEIPDDPKGDAKVDAEGRLLGGREYRPVTFTSDVRRNKERVYALTIDAARACGYTDSLAFLRRCPTVLKLSCNPEERQMLIDIGRVTGNLKNRTITMVAMRNVYKVMGARLVKDGKWVTDDYYEDESLAKCAENGFAPFTSADPDEILANAIASTAPTGRAAQHGDAGAGEGTGAGGRGHSHALAPFYTITGPTTHFAGSGANPWDEAWGGHKRARLNAQGVSREDWMWVLARESREVDGQLKGYRSERLLRLEGRDGEVWAGWEWMRDAEGQREGEDDEGERTKGIHGAGEKGAGAVSSPQAAPVADALLGPPKMERRPSALSQEVTFGPSEGASDGGDVQGQGQRHDGRAGSAVRGSAPAPSPRPVQTSTPPPPPEESYKTPGGVILVETAKQRRAWEKRYNHGVGSLEAGVVRGVIEPHTHTPHVPQHLQPTLSTAPERASYYPLITTAASAALPVKIKGEPSDLNGVAGDSAYRQQQLARQFAQGSVSGPGSKGLASVEYVFEAAAFGGVGLGAGAGAGAVRVDAYGYEVDEEEPPENAPAWAPSVSFGTAGGGVGVLTLGKRVREAEAWEASLRERKREEMEQREQRRAERREERRVEQEERRQREEEEAAVREAQEAEAEAAAEEVARGLAEAEAEAGALAVAASEDVVGEGEGGGGDGDGGGDGPRVEDEGRGEVGGDGKVEEVGDGAGLGAGAGVEAEDDERGAVDGLEGSPNPAPNAGNGHTEKSGDVEMA